LFWKRRLGYIQRKREIVDAELSYMIMMMV
jgi:hypothetical protein